MKKINLVTLLVLLFLYACSSTEKLSAEDKKSPSSSPSNNPYFTKIGQGMPTIILQAGLGDDKSVWQAVLPGLSQSHEVIALDRPGHGNYPVTDQPRDPCSIASEQHALLQASHIAPPYLLVGHSLGGLYQYVFAKLYPEEVAGIVLIDPTPPYHWETMQREVPASAALLRLLRTVAFNQTDRAEFDAQSICLEKIHLNQPLTKPAVVLSAGRFRSEEKGEFESMIKRTRQQWLKLVGIEKLDIVWDSGHYIQKENPEDVLSAIKKVTNQLEQNKP